MEWTEIIRDAVSFIESHITEEITMYDVAGHVNVSPFYFHKGFSILCGYSVTEYIRNRRLALAGEELLTSDATVIELAMKYGYDSPDSFTKAFTRFHGHSPSIVRKNKTMLKAFAPLKLYSRQMKSAVSIAPAAAAKRYISLCGCVHNFILSGQSFRPPV